MEPHPVHFAVFKTSPKADTWPGEKIAAWAEEVSTGSSSKYHLPNTEFTRSELIEFCQHSSNEACFMAIMAWGGMKPHWGRQAWENRNSGLLETINKMRSTPRITRSSAYDEFHSLDSRPGLGPAYFTKLVYFLRPELRGYILDQWTGKSINLLFGPTVYLSAPDRRGAAAVREKNNWRHYEKFCELVDRLGDQLGCSGSETEERLFSIGSIRKRPRGVWRSYVVAEWLKTRPGTGRW